MVPVTGNGPVRRTPHARRRRTSPLRRAWSADHRLQDRTGRRGRTGRTPRATRDTDITAEAEADARQTFRDAATLQTEDGPRIPREPVDEQIAKLLDDHDHVTQLVNNTIAHRRDAFSHGRIVVGVPPLDEATIDTVLDDLTGVAAEWTPLLAGAEVHIRDRDPNPQHLFVRALELFDPDTYLEAIMQRKGQLGPSAPAAAYEAVERDVRTDYVWPNAQD